MLRQGCSDGPEISVPHGAVHPADWELLGMCWDGHYYVNTCLPFGLQSAPYLFDLVALHLNGSFNTITTFPISFTTWMISFWPAHLIPPTVGSSYTAFYE